MDTRTEHNSYTKNEELGLRELIIGIKEWYRSMWSKWVIILILGLTGGAVGFFYAYLSKATYTATTSFVLEEEKSAGVLGSFSGIASMAGVDVNGSSGIFQGENILDLYLSRNMIQKTLLTSINIDGKQQLLVDRYISFNNLREDWTHPELKNISFENPSSFTRLQDSLLGVIVKDIIKKHLNASKPDKKLSMMKVSVAAKDEVFAKLFNNEIVKNVSSFYKQTKIKKSLDNVLILENKRDSVQRVMNGAIYSAAKIADATPNLNPTRLIQRSAPIQRSQFSAETNRAILGQLITNLEMAKITLRKETPLIQVVDEPIYPLERDKVGKAMGIIFGGLLFGFLVVLFLTFKLILSKILSSE